MAMHDHGPPVPPSNSHFFPLDELQHSLQLAEPAVRLANQQRIRRLACITFVGYTPQPTFTSPAQRGDLMDGVGRARHAS
eukprot:5597762-Amphidinium_carterae.1